MAVSLRSSTDLFYKSFAKQVFLTQENALDTGILLTSLQKGMVIKMSQIILGTEKMKAYQGLSMLCEYAGKSEEWCNELWLAVLTDHELYGEFLYYLEHHCFADHIKAAGYSMTDIYVWQMGQDNLFRDTGKNTESCNKEKMVLQAFWTMAKMRKDPSRYEKKLAEDPGLDRT